VIRTICVIGVIGSTTRDLESRRVPRYSVGAPMPVALRRLSLLKRLVLVMSLALAPVVVTSAARADDADHAKELFQQGTTLFTVGEFDKAIEAWQEGYKAKPDPGFLFNIAQAYRLKGDTTKAIFFYRGYLRNSPKAANRADVEAKIAALQKAVADKPGSTPPSPTTPPSSTTPPPASTTLAPASPPPVAPPPMPAAPRPMPVAPPPAEAPPLPAPMSTTLEEPAPAPAPPTPGENRPVDLGLALGFDAWTSGFNAKSVPAQAAVGFSGGYTFGGDVFGASSFRLGALVHTVSVKDQDGNTLGFTSWLLEPSVRIRLADQRLYLTGGLGVGALAMSNIKPTSALLAKPPGGGTYKINGTQGAFELRPAVGLQLHVTKLVVLSMTPALSYSPKKTNFYASEGRFELMFGLTFQL
jgi:hypothetical protein